ncbi:MAG: hypothetical protein DKM50_00625 [Candidatus Margulisiibacteriota bacterium]|nr:MAG: hypothetical protein A2X43_05475 [Candidatus Margulisbacteria bacterium GWD2_39_127]OGI04363.1 MAG: hypothetical protein A2X42_07155 [Candidatus Margulisbacteria bacterium GWF2_38_17]OGI07781.1 MAG: hypothetical protein A2X41_07815 [Candidatus Margulisbacteria bacterium GWE2_39_32]PZM84830.1 MAG: hypothetical protein DKM50_00625 [Candidatus Margulisiibacteriota bacterium]HAR63297.1 hypothetical protein [Candidatus Margulisiibacteriota bacterium]
MELITSDGIKINFEVSGKGKPVIFIHGWTMDQSVYFYQQKELKEYQIITVDLRGHGASDKSEPIDLSFPRMGKDIAELISSLPITSPAIAGWSMGVSIILSSIDTLQPLAGSFIFLSGTPKFIAGDNLSFGMRATIANRLADNIKTDYQPALSNFYQLIYHSECVNKEEKKMLESLFNKLPGLTPQTVAQKTLEHLYEADYRDLLKKILVPTLIISGTLDKICSPAASEYMAKLISNCAFEPIPDAGHMPFLTKSEQCNTIIKDFLNHLYAP